ncbi:MAG: D-glucuronyl C5-epimerase family protein [Candidatus Oleimicrobiaceae bacterium]
MPENPEPIPIAYHFDFAGVENFREYRFDQHGIPQVNYGRHAGWQYNAITVAQYGLAQLTEWSRSAREEARDRARRAARWLVDTCEEYRPGVAAWVYRFDLPFYGPKAPWISAMAQGEAISLLLRIWLLEKDDELVWVARRAFAAFCLPVEQGGVLSSFPDGAPVFEEFPTVPAPHVLNGHIFALLGVHDFWRATGDPHAGDLFAQATRGLQDNLARYDVGWWTLYDLHPTHRLASRMYHRIHVQLIGVLYRLTGESSFRDWEQCWQGYLESPFKCLRWSGAKVVEKARLWGYHV